MMRYEILRASVWALGFRFGGALLSLATTAVVARLLDIESAGSFFWFFSVIILLSMVFRLGVDNLIIKLLAEYPVEVRAEDTTILSAYSIAAGSYLVLGIALTAVFQSIEGIVPDVSLWLTAFSAALFYSLVSVNSAGFQGLKKPVAAIFYQLCLLPLLALVFMVMFFTIYGYTTQSAITAYLVASVIVFFVSYVYLSRSIILKFNTVSVQNLILKAPAFSLAGMMQVFLDQLPVFFAGILLGARETALLAISFRVSSVAGYLNTTISKVLAPYFVRNEDRHSGAIKQTISLMGCVQLLVLIILAVFSHDILNYFGSEYVVAQNLLFLLLISQFILYYMNNIAIRFQMMGKHWFVFESAVLRMAVLGLGAASAVLFPYSLVIVLSVLLSILCGFIYLILRR